MKADKNRIIGAGDVVRLAVEPVAKRLPNQKKKCGCAGRQRKLNDLLPIKERRRGEA
jgi:hypothetical protein